MIRKTSLLSVMILLSGQSLATCAGESDREAMLSLDKSPWDFEHGLVGWERTGTAFDYQPTHGDNVKAMRVAQLSLGGSYWRDVFYPVGHHGSRWIGTHEKFPDDSRSQEPRGSIQGDGPTGTLTSEPFELQERFVTFLIGGGRDPERLRVEILEQNPGGGETLSDGTYRVVPGMSATGHDSNLLRREVFDARALRGHILRIRIVDHASGHWGHINVDDFRFVDVAPTLSVRSGLARDPDAPLWGFVDLHTHPMSHLGFGNKLMHGPPDGDIESALGDCNCTHGGWGLDNQCGNYIRAAIVNTLDDEFIYKTANLHGDHHHAGYPDFAYWPHFTTVTHQQMWHEWIRRTYDGGLRVMVALAVNNHLLAEGLDGDSPMTDKESGDIQIEEMKRFAERHRDFMEIAYSPADLRRIVQENKLAVILGVELDNIGDLHLANGAATEQAVRAEIRRLHGQGVRYMFPIHVVDNQFGGTAIEQSVFNVANRFDQAQPLPRDLDTVTPGQGYQIEHAPDPQVTFHLEPHMETVKILLLRGFVEAIEGMPYPFPWEALTWGHRLQREREYQIVKRFFLTPDPLASSYRQIPPGHRNQKGLTAQGEVAIDEMMHLGVLIDIDHMSERAADQALHLALAVPDGGYPMNSGHNGFRALGHSTENGRTETQIENIAQLGGMMGVGYGYDGPQSPSVQVAEVLDQQGFPRSTGSFIENDCGRTAKQFAQSYLYAVEKLGRVALGTDTNGLISGPGPRFGSLSRLNGNHCVEQNPARDPPVAYEGAAGAQHPLRMAKTGDKAWDINVEGVAHYGLLPDFLQDLSNVGIEPEDLTPLFQGAENFARMWERTKRASAKLRGER